MKAILIDPVDQTIKTIDAADYDSLCKHLEYSKDDPLVRPVMNSEVEGKFDRLYTVRDDSHDIWDKTRKYKIYSQVRLEVNCEASGRKYETANGKLIIFRYAPGYTKLEDVPLTATEAVKLFNIEMYKADNDVIDPELPGLADC